MDKNYRKYEIPPMWDYCPHEMMEYIDGIFKPLVITLTGSYRYKLEPSTTPFVVMGSVTFYHCELFTNELEIVPEGPIRIEYPYGDDGEGVPVQNHVGRIKPGKKLFISPAFLTRYCLPSKIYEYSLSDMNELKSKLYPKHKSEADLTLFSELMSGYAESHTPLYIILYKKLYALESVVEPISPDVRGGFCHEKDLFKRNRVDPHDYPVIFTRHNISEDDMFDGMKDCYAICLLSELYDMAEINKKE